MYNGIMDALHRELSMMDERYASAKTPMTGQDLEIVDKVAHAMKCIATYEAMQNAESRRYERDYYRRY